MIIQKRLFQHQTMCFHKLQQKHKCQFTEVLEAPGKKLVLIGIKMDA